MSCCCWTTLSLVLVGILVLNWIVTSYRRRPKKNFTAKNPTNILITGGVQGIGKLLATKFAGQVAEGAVNIIVIDIRDDLADEMKADLRKESGRPDFKHIHFYKGNLALEENIEQVWA